MDLHEGCCPGLERLILYYTQSGQQCTRVVTGGDGSLGPALRAHLGTQLSGHKTTLPSRVQLGCDIEPIDREPGAPDEGGGGAQQIDRPVSGALDSHDRFREAHG